MKSVVLIFKKRLLFPFKWSVLNLEGKDGLPPSGKTQLSGHRDGKGAATSARQLMGICRQPLQKSYPGQSQS